jgi:hypothetical protein
MECGNCDSVLHVMWCIMDPGTAYFRPPAVFCVLYHMSATSYGRRVPFNVVATTHLMLECMYSFLYATSIFRLLHTGCGGYKRPFAILPDLVFYVSRIQWIARASEVYYTFRVFGKLRTSLVFLLLLQKLRSGCDKCY